MNDLAFIFPGQGSQSVGMGKTLVEASPAAARIFERADAALGGEGISRLCFEGPEDDLVRTANQQPAILTTSVAALEALRERLGGAMPTPVLAAGHSLGEYSALVAAGALSLEDAVQTVRRRGEAMQDAVPAGEGAMAAVIGLASAVVAEVCEAAAEGEVVSPANLNGPGQVVIAGAAAAVERAAAKLEVAGARRIVPLPVSAPFHCALMVPAADRLAAVLAEVSVSSFTFPVVTNVEARPNDDPTRVAELLVRQVTAPVRWEESVQYLAQAGVKRVIEFGPGRVLAGLVRRIDRSLKTQCVGDSGSLEKAMAALGEAGSK